MAFKKKTCPKKFSFGFVVNFARRRKMSSVKQLNPNADIARSIQAMAMNIGAARGLQNVLKSNLGPKGTLKMLVSGSGDIKLTKDGNILLHEMVCNRNFTQEKMN